MVHTELCGSSTEMSGVLGSHAGDISAPEEMDRFLIRQTIAHHRAYHPVKRLLERNLGLMP
jgi:hypothetical protein